MTRLAGAVDGVIGVDTHRDTLAAAATDPVGGCSPRPRSAPTRPATAVCSTSPRRRCPDGAAGRWRVPAATALGWPPFCRPTASGWSRSADPSGRRGAPAPRATRWTPSAPPGRRWPMTIRVAPRRRGDREALRVLLATRHSACVAKVSAINQLKALIVGAPEELRAELRGLATKRQVRRCARLRDRPARSLEHRMTVRALRSTAQRIQLLAAEAAELRAELERLVAASRAVAAGAARGGADQRRPGAGELVARRAGCVRRPPLLPWPAPTPSRRPRGRSPGIG